MHAYASATVRKHGTVIAKYRTTKIQPWPVTAFSALGGFLNNKNIALRLVFFILIVTFLQTFYFTLLINGPLWHFSNIFLICWQVLFCYALYAFQNKNSLKSSVVLKKILVRVNLTTRVVGEVSSPLYPAFRNSLNHYTIFGYKIYLYNNYNCKGSERKKGKCIS